MHIEASDVRSPGMAADQIAATALAAQWIRAGDQHKPGSAVSHGQGPSSAMPTLCVAAARLARSTRQLKYLNPGIDKATVRIWG